MDDTLLVSWALPYPHSEEQDETGQKQINKLNEETKLLALLLNIALKFNSFCVNLMHIHQVCLTAHSMLKGTTAHDLSFDYWPDIVMRHIGQDILTSFHLTIRSERHMWTL